MSAVTFWVTALTGYLLGALFGAVTHVAGDEDLVGILRLTIILGFIALLVLVGVKIGGVA